MSAYGQAEYMSEYVSDPTKDKDNGLAALVRWIPGEIVAVYAAAVTLLKDPVGSQAATITWTLALVLAIVLALLGAKPWTLSGKKARWVLTSSLIFTAAAFCLWSFTIPGSAGYRWDYAAENTEISVLAAFVGLVFGAVADGVTTWIKEKVKD
jgi:hypothetical protein